MVHGDRFIFVYVYKYSIYLHIDIYIYIYICVCVYVCVSEFFVSLCFILSVFLVDFCMSDASQHTTSKQF